MAFSCARMRSASACNHTLAVPKRRKSDGDAADDDDEEESEEEEGEEEVDKDEETDSATELASATEAFASSARADACEAREMESNDGRFSCGDERASASSAGKAGPPLLLIKLTAPVDETIAMDDEEEECECTGEAAFELLMENTALVLGRLEGADARVWESMDDVNGFGVNHCDGSTNEEKNELTVDADCDGGGLAVPAGAGPALEAAVGGTAREEDERPAVKVTGLVRVGASDDESVDGAAGSGISGCAAR